MLQSQVGGYWQLHMQDSQQGRAEAISPTFPALQEEHTLSLYQFTLCVIHWGSEARKRHLPLHAPQLTHPLETNRAFYSLTPSLHDAKVSLCSPKGLALLSVAQFSKLTEHFYLSSGIEAFQTPMESTCTWVPHIYPQNESIKWHFITQQLETLRMKEE